MSIPIIVGYDPGTTAALAIINTKGEVLFLKSKRGYKKGEIIDAITERGKPLLVAGDRVPLSKKVEKLASTLGCKPYHPPKSLSNVEKGELVYSFSEKLRDDHERDALASALRAFRSYSRLFRKAESTLSSVGLGSFYDRVVELMILGKADNLNNAINKVLTKSRMRKPERIEKRVTEPDISKQTVVKLQNRIKTLEKDIAILKKYNEGLREKIRRKEEKINYYRKKREGRVNLNTLRNLKKEIERLKKNLTEKESLILKLKSFRKLELSGYIPIITLERVSQSTVNDLNETVNLENRIIHVKKPENAQILNDYNIKALITPRFDERLLEKVNFPVLTEKDISIENVKNILVVKRDDFEGKIKKARKTGFVQWLEGHKRRKL